MAWIELHQSVVGHRKTFSVADQLGISVPQTIGHLSLFWLWIVDNTTDGRLEGVSDRTISRVAQWSGDAGDFVDALVAAGFLDRDGGTLSVHKWYSYFGKLADARQSNRDRQSRWRERHLTVNPQTVNESPNGYLTVTRPLDNPTTVPNPTEQNSTEPKTMLEKLFEAPPQTSEPESAPVKVRKARTPEKPAFEETSDAYKLTALLIERIVAADPKTKVPKPGDARFWAWAKTMNGLIGHRGPEDVRAVILWCQDEACWWSSRILSASGLVDHFDAMIRQMRTPARPAYNGKTNGRDQTRWPKIEMPKRPNVLHADGTITDADGNLIGREQDGVVIWN